MMNSSSSFPDAERCTPVRIDYSKARQKFAGGGLAKKAEDVRQSGRMGDDMVVHVNKREFDEMRQRWGEPTVNPRTGMPEFFLGDLLGGIGDLITSGSSYIPIVGDSVSSYLQSSPTLAQSLGTAALGAGLGYGISGNSKGTLIGAGIGATIPALYGMFAGPGGAAAPTGAISGTVDNSGGSLSQASGVPTNLSSAAPAAAAASGGGGWSGMSSDKKAMAGIIGALTLASMIGGAKNSKPNAAQKAAQQANQQAQQQFNQPLPAMTFQRALNPYSGDPRLYGFGGANGMGNWYSGNQVPRRVNPIPSQLAKGGRPNGAPMGALMHVSGSSPNYVQGPGGAREDKIPAMLSNNEYVVDAETTALLGDGDPARGAQKLDEMRANIRRHKGSALAKGKISPDAGPAERYLGGRV